MPGEIRTDAKVRYHKFSTATRQISLRNVGVNTLWVSFDRQHWFDIACGTSFDDRVNVKGMWYRTQLGQTRFVVNGLQLNMTDEAVPEPTEDEITQ
jgi:hypothetical protein